MYRPERAAPVHWRVITRAPRAAAARRFEPPDTHYAEVDGVNIAYQVLGEGPIDLVFRTGWLSHLDFQWTDPTYTRLLRNLAGFSRLIMYDQRGIGLSDPVRGTPTLEEHMDDIRGVLDAVGSQRAMLSGSTRRPRPSRPSQLPTRSAPERSWPYGAPPALASPTFLAALSSLR